MPKKKEQCLELTTMSEEEKFYYFLYHAPETKPAELDKIIRNNPIIERAYREVDRYYWTEEELKIYEQEEKRLRDYVASLTFAEEKGEKRGMQQGIQQGIQQGMQQGIQQERKSLIEGMFQAGATLDFIAKSTKLSEQEIKKILGIAG